MRKWLPILAAVLFLAAALPSQVPPIVKTQTVELRIGAAPLFNMAATPAAIATYVGRTVAYSVALESVNDFAGEIRVALTGLPADITVTYFPSDAVTIAPGPARAVQVTLGIPASAAPGTYQLTVTATSTEYN